MEVSAEENDGYAPKILLRSAQPAELLIHGVQRPRSEHAHLIDDQHCLVLPVHSRLSMDESLRLFRQSHAVEIFGQVRARRLVLGEPAG